MKKIISLVLTVVLALSAFTVFAADVDQVQVGNQLKELGVLVGDETGNLMLDRNLTREESIVLLERMLGEAEAAKNTTLKASFSDVQGTWAAPYIAYAELKGLTSGIGNGKFGYNQTASTQEIAAFMLRALGRGDTPWEDTMKVAEEVGLFKGVDKVDATKAILRGEVAVIMHNTLYTKPANSDMQLIKVLGLQDTSNNGIAQIQKVEARNLKQIDVYFTAPVEKAGNQDNWSIKTKGKATITKDSKFDLSDDKMMLTITLDHAAAQQDKFDLTCKDLLEDKITVEDLQFLDVTLPVIEGAEAIGINTVKVMFSEPLMTSDVEKTANYSVKSASGKKLYVKKVVPQKNNTEARVTLYSDLKDGDYTIKVKELQDYAHYGTTTKEYDFTVVEDKEAPTIVSYKDATPYGVTLVWSEDIELKAKPKNGEYEDIYHTNRKDTAFKAEVDGKELKLEFYKENDKKDNHLMPNGTAYLYVNEGAVQDLWNNKNKTILEKVEVEVDREAPSLVEVKVKKQNKIELEFDEKVYLEDAKFKLLKSNGKSAGVDLNFDKKKVDKKVVITFDEDLKAGDYTLVIEGVEDRSGNEMDKTEKDFNMEDKTAPDYTKFTATAYHEAGKQQKLVVEFDDKMDEDSITDKSNFFLVKRNNAQNNEIYVIEHKLDKSDIDFTVENDGERLVIEFPIYKDDDKDKIDLTDFIGTSNGNKGALSIGRLKDAAGNKMEVMNWNIVITDGSDVNNRLEVKAKTTAANEVKVTVKGDVLGNVDDEKITFKLENGTVVKPSSYDAKLDGNETIFTFKFDDKSDFTKPGSITISTEDGFAKNQFGTEAKKLTDFEPTDKAGPIVLKDKKDKEMIELNNLGDLIIHMSEPLKADPDYAKQIVNDLDITIHGKEIKRVKGFTTRVQGSDIVVTFVPTYILDKFGKGDGNSKKIETPLEYDLDIKSVSKPSYILDEAGNAAKAFTDEVTVKAKIVGNTTTGAVVVEP